MLILVISGYWIIEWSLFSYIFRFFQWRFITFLSGRNKRCYFLKKKSALGRFIHNPSKKPLGNACYPTVHSDLNVFCKTGPGNWSADERKGTVHSLPLLVLDQVIWSLSAVSLLVCLMGRVFLPSLKREGGRSVWEGAITHTHKHLGDLKSLAIKSPKWVRGNDW